MSKPSIISIDGVDYIRQDQIPSVPMPDGKYVIVRCRNAGVHAGYLKSRKDGVVTLRIEK